MNINGYNHKLPKELADAIANMKMAKGQIRVTKIDENGNMYEVVEEIEIPYFDNSETDIKDI